MVLYENEMVRRAGVGGGGGTRALDHDVVLVVIQPTKEQPTRRFDVFLGF